VVDHFLAPRAGEAHTTADEMDDPQTKRSMLGIAAGYITSLFEPAAPARPSALASRSSVSQSLVFPNQVWN
jgi:hypothetical protein